MPLSPRNPSANAGCQMPNTGTPRGISAHMPQRQHASASADPPTDTGTTHGLVYQMRCISHSGGVYYMVCYLG